MPPYGGHGFDFDRVADAAYDGGVLVWVVAELTVAKRPYMFRQALGFMERLRLHDTMIYEITARVFGRAAQSLLARIGIYAPFRRNGKGSHRNVANIIP